ncbi:MAG: peptidoglycan-binding protein LysM [Nitrosomonas communis]|nr:peptidoglycan-binding protein LysM [Nitrosomonas communis]
MHMLIIIAAILLTNAFSGITAKAAEIELRHNGPDQKATIKLFPKMRIEKLGMPAIPTIPVNKIKPFLSQPLIIEKDALDKAPVILGSSDNRVILSVGDTIYVRDLPADKGASWQVFRAGKALMDPDDNNRILGYESVYLGDVEAKNYAPISTVKVTHSVQEILSGDRLIRSSADTFSDYVPQAPDFAIKGRIISVYGGVTEIGENAIITLNKGMQAGLKEGHVLAIYRKSEVKSPKGEVVALPDERIGLVFVFRVFDKVSYALVTQSSQAIKVLDAVQAP